MEAFSIIIIIVSCISLYHLYKWIVNNRYINELKSIYPNDIDFRADVNFSSWHILKNIKLKMLFNEKDLIIYGFDYYRNRFTKFIFLNNEKLLLEKINFLPKYYVTDFMFENENQLSIKSKPNQYITVNLKNNQVLQKSLTDQSFLKLLNNIINKPNNNLI